MRTSYNILGEILLMTGDFVGQTFTSEMRHRIQQQALDIMRAAFDEGQAALAPHICTNRRSSDCKLVIADENYDPEMCLMCMLDGGFDY